MEVHRRGARYPHSSHDSGMFSLLRMVFEVVLKVMLVFRNDDDRVTVLVTSCAAILLSVALWRRCGRCWKTSQTWPNTKPHGSGEGGVPILSCRYIGVCILNILLISVCVSFHSVNQDVTGRSQDG